MILFLVILSLIIGVAFGFFISHRQIHKKSKDSTHSAIPNDFFEIQNLVYSFQINKKNRSITLSSRFNSTFKLKDHLGLVSFCENLVAHDRKKQAELLDFLEKVVHHGQNTNFTLVLPHEKKLKFSIYKPSLDTGTIQGTIQDLSLEQKLKAKELDLDSQLQFSSKLAALGDISGEMIKGLNSPLTLISTSIRKIEKNISESEKPNLEKISINLQRIYQTMKNIDRLEFLKKKEKIEKVDLALHLKESIEQVQQLVYEKSIDLRIQVPHQPIYVFIKPIHLKVALLEILNNAIESIENLPLEKDRWISVSALESNGLIEISLADSGVGISTENVDKIFDPHFSTKEDIKGAGLGLPIARAIIQYNSGTLNYDPDYGSSCFRITLPEFKEQLLEL